LGLPVNLDPQVTSKVILATADGGDPSVLFLVAEVPNSTTSFVDNTVETSLVVNQQYLFTDEFGNEFGISQNDPPPQGTLGRRIVLRDPEFVSELIGEEILLVNDQRSLHSVIHERGSGVGNLCH